MNSLEQYFETIIQCVGSFYWAIGILLLFLKVPRCQEYGPYIRAKKFLAFTYWVMGTNLYVWLWLCHHDWHHLNPYVFFTDVSLFYLAAVFFGHSFCSLLDGSCARPKKLAIDLSTWLLMMCLLSFTLSSSVSPVLRYALMGVSLLMFLDLVVRFIVRFRRLYAQKSQMLENYYSEDMQQFMFWTKKSIFFILMSGVLALFTLCFGIFFNYVYQLYMVVINLYIAISFINYANQYGKLYSPVQEMKEEETVVTETEPRNLSVDNLENIFGSRLAQWIDDKKYLDMQFTIEDLAVSMGTNKFYMSRYINGKYNTNFRSWVTGLRVEEAKAYMKQNPSFKMEEVALHSGFSSLSYFSKVFSRIEGMTPLAWRKENLLIGG